MNTPSERSPMLPLSEILAERARVASHEAGHVRAAVAGQRYVAAAADGNGGYAVWGSKGMDSETLALAAACGPEAERLADRIEWPHITDSAEAPTPAHANLLAHCREESPAWPSDYEVMKRWATSTAEESDWAPRMNLLRRRAQLFVGQHAAEITNLAIVIYAKGAILPSEVAALVPSFLPPPTTAPTKRRARRASPAVAS